MTNRLTPWIVCFAASLFFAYELMQLHMLNAISPMLMKDLSLSATDLGYLGSTYVLADVLFLLPAGIILDRYSTRKVILSALFFCILGTFGFALSKTLTQACISHFLSGIGNAFCFLSCMMLVARWFPPRQQSMVVGFMITMGMLGAVIAQEPFTQLAQYFTWREALQIDAFIGLLIFAVVFIFVKDFPGVLKSPSAVRSELPFFSSLTQSLANPQNIYCGLYTGFMNLPLMIISATYANLFLSQVHHIPLEKASFIASMIAMGTIVGSPLFGILSDWFGEKKPFMFLGAIFSIITFSLIMFVPYPSYSLFLSLFFILGVVTSAQVLGYPLVTESSPQHLVGTSQGIAAVVIMGLAFVLNVVAGHLLDFGWGGVMIDGQRMYSYSDFMRSFAIFPIGFVVSFFLVFYLKEPKGAIQQVKA